MRRNEGTRNVNIDFKTTYWPNKKIIIAFRTYIVNFDSAENTAKTTSFILY